MDETPDFQLKIVREHRRPRSQAPKGPAPAQTAKADAPADQPPPRDSSRSSRSAGHHRRHYSDYGTIDLGELSPPGKTRPAPTRTEGQAQQEFLERYRPVLDRKYRSDRSGNLAGPALIAGAILIFLLLGILVFFRSPAEPDPTPSVETIPVVDVNEIG